MFVLRELLKIRVKENYELEKQGCPKDRILITPNEAKRFGEQNTANLCNPKG